MERNTSHKRRRLGPVLTVIFLIAMVMGPGPGVELINPDRTNPDATYRVLGLPVIYAWGLLWYGVQVAVIVTAYFTVWREGEDG